MIKEFGDHVEPILLDVTDTGSILSAAKSVEDKVGDAGLAGLINNAGIGLAGPLECLPPKDLSHQFEVNVLGPFSVTQAFLPLIRKARGRIINTGSIGGRLTIPFGGALCASKAAVASLNDALRLELSAFGINVCLIEPASIHTEAVGKFSSEIAARLAGMTPEDRNHYEKAFTSFAKMALEEETHGSPPEVVAETIFRALTDCPPKSRYLCGKKSRILALLAWLLPARALDKVLLSQFGLKNWKTENGAMRP